MHCSSPFIFNGASPKLWEKVTSWALYTAHYCVSRNIFSLNLHSNMKQMYMYARMNCSEPSKKAILNAVYLGIQDLFIEHLSLIYYDSFAGL